ncbi:PAS domain S-box-containing protein [Sinorhizobium kostiense]|uniref:histidine kinase n=1 Tax=Sinorhizobium kostiense TaxID=76747 RepID=A0ABS4QY57_9HYPH|nr:PAS domain S-box protein [Sinorhizobium kostiense]MBP2235582.1 PAS domain S-box-containing protein [Sinorhizobium kostiense]
MPARHYPFIDIAVHQRVREHFARGDACVLFSKDLARVLWANDQGAKLFDMASVYDFIDAALDMNDLSLRQLRAAAAQLATIGDRRQLLIRISAGFRRLPLNATVELIRIQAGEDAVLFTAPHNGKTLSTKDRAAAMIAGLDGPDTHMAVLDDEGEVIAQSIGFERLGLSAPVRRTLVSAVARDKDRLIKRPVATEKGQLPAAIGRISDYPALHLLFAVEAALEGTDVEHEAQGQNDSIEVEILPPVTSDEASPPGAEEPREAAEEDVSGTSSTGEATEEAGEPIGEGEAVKTQEELDFEPAGGVEQEKTGEQVLPLDPLKATRGDREREALPPDFVFNPAGRAVRFVWKIDAEGRFSEISEEFASAVGPNAADVIGVTFEELAARYDLDPDNKINELLHRRDTWSGKTILWPVEGTALKVPVDLAALPTYSRTREFDGFRGFGIVRVADAVPDEKASGRSLGRTSDERTEPQGRGEAAEQITDAPELGEPQSDAASAEGARVVPAPGSGPEDKRAERVAAADDPFSGERPALHIVDTPERPSSDKIIDLDERRPAGGAALTRGEQAAFREIARQLAARFDAPGDIASEDKVQSATEGRLAQEETSVPAATERTGSRSETAAEDRPPPAAGAVAGPAERIGVVLSSEILDGLPVALLIHCGDELLHANPAFLRLSGYHDLQSFGREGGLAALFAHSGEHAPEADGTMTLVRASGELVQVSAYLHSIRWEGRSALMLALSPSPMPGDAAKEGEAAVTVEARLRMEIEELRSILETATDGVVVLGQDGDIRTMNRSASALFNYDEDEMRGKPFAALFAHESQKAVIDYLQGLSGHGVASVLNDGREVIGREAGGGFIPLFMTIGRLASSNGYCAVIRDITQWKRTEEELRNAKRAAETANAHKTEFLARVSHEIRTPLNAIIGFSDMMASEHFGPVGHPRYIEYAGDIGRSGRHVLDIVNDLLDISKIEAGEMELEFSAVDLNEAISEAVSLVQPQANSQRVIIRTSLSASVPEVVADGRSIKQIALNILANAIRFTPSGGQIVVSTAYEANGSVILRIRDTGIGMSRNELDQAMKPFRQVTTGGRKRGDGTGLGLPLTKAMAEANRAQFSINSAPNEGTLVEIAFPSQRVLAN